MNFIRFGKNIYELVREVISIYTLEEYINNLLNRVDAIEKRLGVPQSADDDPGAILLPPGPGTPIQIFAENITVNIDPSKFPMEDFWPEDQEERYLICGKTQSVVWAWYYIGEVNSNYQVVTFGGKIEGIANVKKTVAGCCTEWDKDNKRPKMGLGTKCFVYGAQRDVNAIRVIGGHNNRANMPLAIGFMAPL
ncbi:hypothetical protein BwiPL1_20810 [Bacillus wiedmannii]|nr:hypothetical protein BwiPL1_20810 [Bacillus wiedmannii]